MQSGVSHVSQLLSATEVAEMLRLDSYTVRKYAREGYIPAYKVGKSYRFDRERVLSWLSSREVHPAAGAAAVLPPEDEPAQLRAL